MKVEAQVSFVVQSQKAEIRGGGAGKENIRNQPRVLLSLYLYDCGLTLFSLHACFKKTSVRSNSLKAVAYTVLHVAAGWYCMRICTHS